MKRLLIALLMMAGVSQATLVEDLVRTDDVVTTPEGDTRYLYAGSTTNKTLIDAKLEQAYINAKDYGAVGNGIADDTEELQAAIDAADTAQTPLFIPAGEYKITDTLTNRPSHHGTIIRGAGQYSTELKQYTAGKTCLMIDSQDYVGDTNSWEGLTVEDMNFTGAGIGGGAGLHVAGGNGTMARVYIKGVQAGNSYHGILIEDADQSCIIASAAQQNAVGIRVAGNSNGFNLLNTVVTGNSIGGMDIDQGTGINIIGCDIGNGTTFAGEYLVLANNNSLIVEGCNFEIHKDLQACVIQTNACHLTLTGNIFGRNAAPTWTNPAIVIAGAGTYPYTHMYNNVISGLSAGVAGIVRFSDSAYIWGTANTLYTSGSTAAAANIMTVTLGGSTWPEYDSVRDVRTISPIPTTWKTVTPDLKTTGQLHWKYSSDNSPDDLYAVYATSSNTYAMSSLINDNLGTSGADFSGAVTFEAGSGPDFAGTSRYAENVFMVWSNSVDLTIHGAYGSRIGNGGNGNDPKMIFFEVGTPVDQPEAVADATDAASVITQLNLLLNRIRSLGLIKDGTTDTN